MPLPFLRQRSIKTKLRTLAAASTGLALLLASAGFLANDWRLMRNTKVAQLRTQAALIAHACKPALERGDQDAANQLLSSMATQPSIQLAVLYDRTLLPLGLYARESIASPPAIPEFYGSRFTDSGSVEWTYPVDVGEVRLGTLFIRDDLSDLRLQMRDHRLPVLFVTLTSLSVALILSLRMQRGIAAPIVELAETAREITDNADYSKRVVALSDDELGMLYEAFNRLLIQVDFSERAQQMAQADLERRVNDRTKQLVAEIGERERTQAALVKAKDSAEAANRAKSEFLANMSHEIRTPLNAILGFTDLLLRGAARDSEEQNSFLSTIHNSGQHLLSLLNDILDLSKIEAGQLRVEIIPCSPHQIVAEVVSIMRVRALEQGLKLDYHWIGAVPASITTDPARLRQLLLNVVGNAIKFTRAGGVEVVARLVSRDIDPQLEIQVIDTGIGIPQDKLDQIFDPFCQADTSVTRRFGGTGLGLAICRRIAHALGGSIEVESQADVGSTFTIRVATGSLAQVTMLERPSGDVLPEIHSTRAPAPNQFAGLRVLVADDGDSNRRLIGLLLERAGAIVFAAEDGRQAVDQATQHPVDLILMDMQMPEVDGYTATQRLRESGLTIPIVALTAHAMKGDEEKCRAAGCSHYLTKPIDRERLFSVVRACLPNLVGIDASNDAPAAANVDCDTDEPLCSTLPTDDAEFADIVREFLVRFEDRLGQMHAAMHQNDFEILVSLAHWLKGAGGTAGYQPLTDEARILERAAGQANMAACRESLAALDALSARIAREPIS